MTAGKISHSNDSTITFEQKMKQIADLKVLLSLNVYESKCRQCCVKTVITIITKTAEKEHLAEI